MSKFKMESEKMTPHQIWAKSSDKNSKGTPVSLEEHIKSVYTAAKNILNEINQYLPAELDKEALKELVYASVVLHDIGKANKAFQDMLRGELGQKQQPLRHEALSALITAGAIKETKNFSHWLREQAFSHRPSEWVWMVAWVAGGHHLKLHHYADHEHGELARTSSVDDIEFYWTSIFQHACGSGFCLAGVRCDCKWKAGNTGLYVIL